MIALLGALILVIGAAVLWSVIEHHLAQISSRAASRAGAPSYGREGTAADGAAVPDLFDQELVR